MNHGEWSPSSGAHDVAGMAGMQLAVWGVWIDPTSGSADYQIGRNYEFNCAAELPNLPEGHNIKINRAADGSLRVCKMQGETGVPTIDYRSVQDDREDRNASKISMLEYDKENKALRRYLPILSTISVVCLILFVLTAFQWIYCLEDNLDDRPDPETGICFA